MATFQGIVNRQNNLTQEIDSTPKRFDDIAAAQYGQTQQPLNSPTPDITIAQEPARYNNGHTTVASDMTHSQEPGIPPANTIVSNGELPQAAIEPAPATPQNKAALQNYIESQDFAPPDQSAVDVLPTNDLLKIAAAMDSLNAQLNDAGIQFTSDQQRNLGALRDQVVQALEARGFSADDIASRVGTLREHYSATELLSSTQVVAQELQQQAAMQQDPAQHQLEQQQVTGTSSNLSALAEHFRSSGMGAIGGVIALVAKIADQAAEQAQQADGVELSSNISYDPRKGNANVITETLVEDTAFAGLDGIKGLDGLSLENVTFGGDVVETAALGYMAAQSTPAMSPQQPDRGHGVA